MSEAISSGDSGQDLNIPVLETQWGDLSVGVTDQNQIFITFGNEGFEPPAEGETPFFWESIVFVFPGEDQEKSLELVKTSVDVNLIKGEIDGVRGIDIQNRILYGIEQNGLEVDRHDLDIWYTL